MTTTQHTPVPLPPGAVEAGEWEMHSGITRMFLNPTRGTGKLTVGIVGEQDYSGEVLRRTVLVCANDGHRTAVIDLDETELREHIAAAQAIAEELRALVDAEGS